MKKLLAAILILTSAAAAAQTPRHELPRRHIRPYPTVDEALAASDAASAYVSPLAEPERSEADGKVSFTTSYVYPAAWLNRQLLLRVESASAGYTVSVNGQTAGYVESGAAAAEFNVTKLSQQGLNTLTVTLDDPAAGAPLIKTGTPWLGRMEVICQPALRLRDLDYRTRLNESGDAVVEFALAVKTDVLNPKRSRISYQLVAPDTTTLEQGWRDIALDMRGEDTLRFTTVVPAKWLWSADTPTLLTLVVRNRLNGRYVENLAIPVGIRTVEHRDGELFINGQYTAVYARVVSPNTPEQELAKLKGYGYNAVTFEAGEAPQSLYDACDRAGIFAIPETAIDTSEGGQSIRRGGNPSNDPALTGRYLERTGAMYHTSKSHPSVIAFSLGRGKTNGINPYESYLLLKRGGEKRPVIYEGAQMEWNNDEFYLFIDRGDK